MITKMVDHLITMIRPAAPTPQTMQMIQGNAENWGYNTLTILMDHYKEGLDQALTDLDKLLMPEWKTAFQVATRWARRKLPRLTRDAIDHAEAVITERVIASEGREVQEAALTEERTTAAVQTEQEGPQREKSPEAPLPAPPAVRPKRPALKSASTMTYPQDFSASEGEEELQWYQAPRERQAAIPRGYRRSSGSSDDDELPSFQAPRGKQSSPKVQRHIAMPHTRTIRGQILDLPPEEDQPDLIDWHAVETPAPIPPRDFPSGFFEVRIEGEDSEPQSPVPSNKSSSCRIPTPVQHIVMVHREQQQDRDTSLSQSLNNSEPCFQPRRHRATAQKSADWDLVVEKKWLLMGDSNLSHLPDHSFQDLQIEAFPGGHFRHAQILLDKAFPPRNLVVEKIVLAFGINSRTNKPKETTIKNLQAAIRAAKKKFPFADVYVPLVNFSTDLPLEEQLNLRILNEHILRNMTFIPLLPSHLFRTQEDNIHWTKETGKAMLEHWWQELNWPPL